MTMHLIRGVCTLNTRKPKSKATKAQLAQWEIDWREDNKWRKSNGMERMTLEQYIDYRLGKSPKYKTKFEPLRTVSRVSDLDQHRKLYPSQEMSGGNTARKDSMVYSGERKLLGIATMHKSNMVPVFDQESAVDIARMRRN